MTRRAILKVFLAGLVLSVIVLLAVPLNQSSKTIEDCGPPPVVDCGFGVNDYKDITQSGWPFASTSTTRTPDIYGRLYPEDSSRKQVEVRYLGLLLDALIISLLLTLSFAVVFRAVNHYAHSRN